MTRRRFFACTCLALSACATAPHDAPPSPATTDPVDIAAISHRPSRVVDVAAAKDFASANNTFGFELWREVRGRDNLSISPASISLALGMTWTGARGETATQMSKVLHMTDVPTMAAAMGDQLAAWNGADQSAVQLSVVDRLFGEQSATFEPDFLALMNDRFGAPLEPVDFIRGFEAARGRINGWVKDETKDRIVDLLPIGSLDTDTRLVLTNAVYFKGDWRRGFDPEETHAATFWADGRTARSTQLMRQVSQYGYAADDTLQIVELPYKGDGMAMDILLPKQRDGLDALEQGLDAARFAELVGKLQPTMVDVTLPKFELKMSSSLALKEPLSRMGMAGAFDGSADFTGISQTIRPLFIDDVFHRTFVALDEKGTEAAAATAVVMRTESASADPEGLAFRADHPFAFVLRDTRTGAVMFIGQLTDPT